MATKLPHSFSDQILSIRKRRRKGRVALADALTCWLLALVFIAGLVWLFAFFIPRVVEPKSDTTHFLEKNFPMD